MIPRLICKLLGHRWLRWEPWGDDYFERSCERCMAYEMKEARW